MSQVRSRDSKIEVNFRSALWRAGYRYRKNARNYFGKPDVVLKKYKIVAFIDSCFWHGCKKHCRRPATNKKYWINKIERNKRQDKKVSRYYKKIGWRGIRIWEHEIKNDLDKVIKKLRITKSPKPIKKLTRRFINYTA